MPRQEQERPNRWSRYVSVSAMQERDEANRWDRFRSAQSAQLEQPVDPLAALTGGFVRALTEPATIIEPVHRISESMRQYYGDSLGTKIPYGLGYIAGTLLPGAAVFKVGGRVARGLGFVSSIRRADQVADLTRVGRFTRGAVAGALYSAGIHADDPGEYARRMLLMGGVGGVGDVAVEGALAALSARFGNKVSPQIQQLAEEALAEEAATAAAARHTPEGIAAHARAMALLDDLDNTIGFTAEQQRYYQALVDRGIEAPPANVQPAATRRMTLGIGVSKLNLQDMAPGQYRIINTPHGDAQDLSSILGRIEGLEHRVVNRKDGQMVIAGLSKEGAEDLGGLASDLERYGFVRGQHVLYRGQRWTALKPTKAGDKLHISQPGRTKKPLVVGLDEIKLMPIVDDIANVPASKISPLVAKFIEQNRIIPEEMSFDDAFSVFADAHKLDSATRVGLRESLIKRVRQELIKEDPELAVVIKNLDEASDVSIARGHPDGPLDEMAAMSGAVVRKVWEDGAWKFVAMDEAGNIISPKLGSRKDMLHWLRNYPRELSNINPRGVNIPDETIPGVGTPSMSPHTAIDPGSVHFSPALVALSRWLPRAHVLRFMEDALRKAGVTDVEPYTKIFFPLVTARRRFNAETATWLQGGKLEDGTVVKGLLEIFNPKKPTIRAKMRENVTDMLETPRSQWTSFAKKHGLNEQEVKTAGEMRDWFNAMFARYVNDDNITITGDDFIENYWPHYRALSDTHAGPSVQQALKRAFPDRKFNAPTVKFLSEMQRKGIMPKYDKDPFNVMFKYLRTGLYKSHMKGVVDEAEKHFNRIPVGGINPATGRMEVNPSLAQMRTTLMDYLRLASYGAPEAFTTTNAAFSEFTRLLGLPVDVTTRDKIVNTYLTLNYGAYLGFRPGLAIRNGYQMILTGYPLLGGKYLARGMKVVARDTEAAYNNAVRRGIVAPGHAPVPSSDLLYAEYASAAQDAGATSLLSKTRKGAEAATSLGMRWYTGFDQINRQAISEGMYAKVHDMWNLYGAGGDMEKFFSKSGINYFGESVKAAFEAKRVSAGIDAAADYMATIAAGDTQFLYELGAGPSLFAHGWGRLLGQYGTFPSWYTAYMAQGIKNLKGMDRALFLARNAAAHKAVIVAGAAIGWNMSRWTGISSLSWMGGPAVDWFYDFRNIFTGITSAGEPTAGRSVSLSEMGLRDMGESPSVLREFVPSVATSILPQAIGGRLGMAQDPRDRWRLASYFFGTVTPGYLLYKDIFREDTGVLDQPDALSAVGRLLSIPLETPGYEYPEINIR